MMTEINIATCEISGCNLPNGSRAVTFQSNEGTVALVFQTPEEIYQAGCLLATQFELFVSVYRGPLPSAWEPPATLPHRHSCLDL